MKRLVGLHGDRLLLAHLREAGFLPRLAARDRDEVIRGARAGGRAGREARARAVLAQAVLAREAIMPTGVGQGIAIPHARLPGLAAPVAALALCEPGVDFGGPDGELARFVVLVVTPEDDDLIQLELLAEVARTFQDPQMRAAVARATSFDDLADALRRVPALREG